ncbi:MAG: hypothetical protein ABI346_03850 [Candidatus Baltobacteraceae bacterium]
MSSVLQADRQTALFADYNRSSFAFEHSLHQSDIFESGQLIAMSARLPDAAYYSTADSSVGDGWKRLGDGRASLAETLERLDETNSLVLLKRCERDPRYGALFRELMAEVVERCGGALRDDLDVGRATLVISSPGRVTSYHIDAEVNFLFQVRGRKLLHAFDPNDRTLLSETELEGFYGGDCDAARYKVERQNEARVFPLEPGKGVHLPLHAPHWTQNLDGISVGVSLNFTLRSGVRLAKLYEANARLRRVGISPSAPGASSWQDQLKLAAIAGVSCARPLLRRPFAKAFT